MADYGTGGWVPEVFDLAGASVGTQKEQGAFEAKTEPVRGGLGSSSTNCT